MSLVLRKIVLQHFLFERALVRSPDPCPDGRGPSGSFSKRIDGGVLPDSEGLFASDTGELGSGAPRPDSGLPPWKRIIDLGVLACTALIWLPLMTLVLCVTKLASSGPAIYRQQRVGYRGKHFMIFKFRTMRVSAETRTHEEYLEQLMSSDAPMIKLDASDPRLVPCGRFLRATGLDELPQIFNVIRGEMSLVGPRPCTAVEFQRYRPEQRDRVNAPPGITGFWQVNGKNKTTFNEMIAMDIFYAENMSLSLDLAIICKTIPSIVSQMLESPVAVPAETPKGARQTAARATSRLERSTGKA